MCSALADVRYGPKADIGITRCASRKEARRRLLGGQVADLTANLSRRGSIRVDVSIDRVAPYGGEQRVESFLAPGESLRGELQDLRGCDASGDGSRRTRARRRARRHGRRGGTVRRLAQPNVDRNCGVLVTEVGVVLIDDMVIEDWF